MGSGSCQFTWIACTPGSVLPCLARVCLWYRGCAEEPIKVLIVRDPKGRKDDDFFFCTNPEVSEEGIIERHYGRWSIEEVIRDG